jgi:hypothetical protein
MTSRETDPGSTMPTGVATARRPSMLRRRIDGIRRWVDEASTPHPGICRPDSADVSAVLMLWMAGRAVNIMLLGAWYAIAKGLGWSFGAAGRPVGGFLPFLTDWDADRYGRISRVGYPQTLPVDIAGNVEPNDWAFLPVFPYLERAIGQATGLSWQLAGVLMSVVFSAAATVVLFLLLRAVTTPAAAWWAVVIFTFGPLSFVYVLAYAETLFLLLTFTALLLAVRRRYAWIVPLGIVSAFTRPGALALALMLGILFVVRWLRRGSDPFPIRERVWLLAAGMSTAVAGLAWSWIADAVTGTPHAYILTETSWWTPWVGDGAFVPLTPWFRFFGTYLGVFGWVVVLGLMGLFLWWMRSQPIRRLGLVVAAYALSYGLYLFAVFLPQQSTFRLALPMTPLLADERIVRAARRPLVTMSVLVALQAIAVLFLWVLGHP